MPLLHGPMGKLRGTSRRFDQFEHVKHDESHPELSRILLSLQPSQAFIKIPFGRGSDNSHGARHKQRLETRASAETLRGHATE